MLIAFDIFKSRQFRRLAVVFVFFCVSIYCFRIQANVSFEESRLSFDSKSILEFPRNFFVTFPPDIKYSGDIESSPQVPQLEDHDDIDKEKSNKRPKQNILFLKTHKCGTSSMVNIFYLYGVRRRLNFVIEPWKRQLDVSKDLLGPRKGGQYNIQCAHAIFNPEIQHQLLPKETTFYTTIIRSPIKRFVSAFSYFGKDKTTKFDEENSDVTLSLDETIRKWFSQEEAKISPTNTSCYLDYVVNGLSRDLGFSVYLEREGSLQRKIDDFVEDMVKEFDFILLTDYFDESLVLLKEEMGWEYRDIFFMKRFYTTDRSRKDSTLSPETEYLIHKYNLVDVQLYNVFYQIFRQKVREFGEELLQEKVSEFRLLRDDFENKCYKKPENSEVFKKNEWELTEWGKKEHACTFLHLQDIKIDFMISELQATSDFTDKEGEEDVTRVYKKTPMALEEKEFMLAIQNAHDKHASG